MRVNNVKKLLKDNGLKWLDFKSWMRGQTIGVYPDGSPNYYSYDIDRFIEGELYVEKQTKKH